MIIYRTFNGSIVGTKSNNYIMCRYYKQSGIIHTNQHTKYKYLNAKKVNRLLTTTTAVKVLTILLSGVLL